MTRHRPATDDETAFGLAKTHAAQALQQQVLNELGRGELSTRLPDLSRQIGTACSSACCPAHL